MFSHVTLGTRDIRKAVAFYDPLLAGLGLARQESDMENGYAGYAAAPEEKRRVIVDPPAR